jgi:hypothetical protein
MACWSKLIPLLDRLTDIVHTLGKYDTLNDANLWDAYHDTITDITTLWSDASGYQLRKKTKK